MTELSPQRAIELVATTISSIFAEELQKAPDDPEAAWNHAVERTPERHEWFNETVKEVMFHAFGIGTSGDAWLFSPQFWEKFTLILPPMQSHEKQIAALSKLKGVPENRLRKRHFAYLRGAVLKQHPGSTAIN